MRVDHTSNAHTRLTHMDLTLILKVPLSMSMESYPSVFVFRRNIHPGSGSLGRSTQNHSEYK